jgi:hypothetical protein
MHVHAYDILSGFMPRSNEPYLSSDFDMDTLFLLEEQITPCPTSWFRTSFSPINFIHLFYRYCVLKKNINSFKNKKAANVYTETLLKIKFFNIF